VYKRSLYKDVKLIVGRRIVVQNDKFVTANTQPTKDFRDLQSHLHVIVANTLATRVSWCLSNHCLAVISVQGHWNSRCRRPPNREDSMKLAATARNRSKSDTSIVKISRTSTCNLTQLFRLP